MKRGAAVFAALAAGAAQGCPPAPADGARLDAGGVQLAWAPDDARGIVVGRPFALRVRVCPAGTTLHRVDATMPEHRHGMNYRPRVVALGDGRFHVEGLMFHMAGRWELVFELGEPAAPQRLRADLVLR